MRGGFRGAALLAAMLLFGAACTLTGTSQTANNSPATSASTAATPSSSPTASPSGVGTPPSSTPPASPSSSPSGSALAITSTSLHLGEVGIAYPPAAFAAS